MRSNISRLVFLIWLTAWVGGCTSTVTQQKPSDSLATAAKPAEIDGPPLFVPADLSLIPDAVPQTEVLCRGCTRPYKIAGIRYVPKASSSGYREQGNASWYGTAFHGKPTASGEPYDMFAMTAAHKTLPLPSYVRVRHLQNGREVTVKVNDRGPFHTGRIIDLSYAAAVKLGIDKAGSAAVEVEALSTTSAVASNSPPGLSQQKLAGAYYQAGAYADQQNADNVKSKLLAGGVEPVVIIKVEVSGRTLHRVRVGPVSTEVEMLTLAQLRDMGIPGTKVVIR